MSFAGAIPFTSAYFGRGTGAILIDYVSCIGNEQFLANCTNHGIGITSSWCGHDDDAGVQCPGNLKLDLGLVSLQNFNDHTFANKISMTIMLR